MGKWFDWWMVSHFLLWAIMLGWLRWFFVELPLPWALTIIGFGSLTWEAVEYFREYHLGYSHEAWNNRLIVDPLTNLTGGLTGWYIVGLFI